MTTERAAGAVTVAHLLEELARELNMAGIAEPFSEAREIVSALYDAPRFWPLLNGAVAVDSETLARARRAVERRSRGAPLAYAVGRANFRHLTLDVDERVLIPRPETEQLVDLVLEVCARDGAPGVAMDVGTGSGCLLATLLCELEGARGTGTDISQAALAVARGNASRLGVSQRSSWLIADGLETVPGTFHMLISNPPYVRTGEIAHLEPEVRNFDPAAALDGGADGLALYRAWAPWLRRLVPDGWIVLEVGYDQADAVASIIASGMGQAVAEAHIYRDVAGTRRCVAMRARAGTHA